MILSHAHRFIFIKGRKVAGTSVEIALSTICGPDDVVTPLPPADERERVALGTASRNYAARRALEAAYLRLVFTDTNAPPRAIFYNHMPLSEVEALAGPLHGYRIVAAERSPYAKLLSYLNMMQAGPGMQGDPPRFEAQFDRLPDVAIVRNIHLYRDSAHALRAELLRYETLERDLAGFAASLGVTLPPLPHAKRGLMSDGLDPRALLRRDQIDLINAHYAEEFDAFGYPML